MQKGIILIILLIAAILPPLDFYIVNLALTPIQKEFNNSTSQLQMIIAFYTCAYAVFQITAGRLGDLVGRKLMFLTGLMGFVCSSAICGWSNSMNIMIMGRVFQGISAAIMAPQILAIIHVTYTEKEKTKVMALYSFTFGMAAVLGQYLGGILISYNIFDLGWRVIFLINIPVGLAAWIGAIYFLPKTDKVLNGYIDFIGIVLLSVSLGLIVYPLTLISESGFSINTVIMMVSGTALMVLFIVYEKNVVRIGKVPLVNMALFQHRNLTLGSIVAFLFYSSGIFYLTLSIYLQLDRGWNELEAGRSIIPFGLAFITASLLSPIVVKWIGNSILQVGLFLKACGFMCIVYSISLPNPTSYLFIIGLVIAGAGMGFTLSSLIRISLQGIPILYSGLASGVVNCALLMGSAIGVAAIGSVFFSLSKRHDYTYALQVSLIVVVVLFTLAFFIAIPITKKKMKTFNILPITLFFLFNSCVTPSKRMSEKDFNRIIVLGQAPLEILLELGFKEKIVGVAYLDAPEVLEDHSEIPLMSIGWTDKESVLSLKPDLIFALESAFRSDKIGDVEFWESRGIRVCVIDNYKEDKNLENYKIDLTKTGELFGIENKTDSIIHHFSNINQKYHQRRTHASKRVLHLSYTGTASKYYYYPPTMCLVDDIIRNCGGEYINLGSNYFILPMETIIQSDPDKIVITWFRRQNGVSLIEQLYANPHFKHLKAIKNRQVIEIDYTQAIRGTLNMEPTYLSISNFLKL